MKMKGIYIAAALLSSLVVEGAVSHIIPQNSFISEAVAQRRNDAIPGSDVHRNQRFEGRQQSRGSTSGTPRECYGFFPGPRGRQCCDRSYSASPRGTMSNPARRAQLVACAGREPVGG